MKKSKRIYNTIMLIIVVAMVTFILTSAYTYKKIENTSLYANTKILNSDFVRKINTLKNIIDTEYIADINEEELLDGAVKGYVDGLGDEYTEYFTKREMEEFKEETDGNYVGIGIYMALNTKDDTIVIIRPIENSPAEKAGILSGDVIKKIDDVEYTTEDFDKITSYIKGKEGTTVKLEIERNGEILTFEVERKSIDLYPIKSEILDNNIGYIQISSFDNESSKEFKQTYNELNKNNINGLIIDLRDNGGGIVDEALEIADYILEKDQTILITKDKEGKEEIEKSKKKPIINVPIAVLTNENTASASEILTAALKENGKATIVGKQTYGKGVIQELITLTDGSGLKVTVEEYYTPNRNKINNVGIDPDKEIDLPEDVISLTNIERKYDTQLQGALNILKK